MKITFVGAGSFRFTGRLVGDIVSFPELRKDLVISFMDIDAEKLKVTEALVKKMLESLKLKVRVETSLSRKKALKGADYVINTIQVGGLDLYGVDMQIPKKYGIRQTVGDTVGPGGIFRGLRTIPVMLDILRDMEKLCPEAVFLNYTNPMAIITWAMYRGSGIKSYGLCHSVQGTHDDIAFYLGIKPEELSSTAAGINHSSWFLKLERKGKDMYPALKRRVKTPGIRNKKIWGNLTDAVRFDLMDRFGYFATESSMHHAEYSPYYLKDKEAVKKYHIDFWGSEKDRRDYLKYLKETKRNIKEKKKIKLEKTKEYAPLIIHSMETGELRKCNMNVENTGLITNLPEGSCVEVPCMIDKGGVAPVYVGDLPLGIASYCSRLVFAQGLAVEASFTGRKDLVYQALLADPLTGSILRTDRVIAMADEFFKREKKFLPQFK